MRVSLKSLWKLFWYDLVIFFREPFFALPILLLPGIFFIVYAGSIARGQSDLSGFAQYIPMYMILICFLTVFFNIGTQYVTDKQNGIFKRILLSPISLSYLVLTYSLRGLFVSILGYFEMLAIAVFVFKIPLGENMFLFFLSFIVIVMIMMLLSLTLHGFFKNSRQAMPFTIVGFQYVLFASGMIMPVENMSKFMQVIVYINPIYHMNQVLLNVWFAELPRLVNLLALLVWILVCFVLIRIQKGFAVDK